jgi:hypothetical protein
LNYDFFDFFNHSNQKKHTKIIVQTIYLYKICHRWRKKRRRWLNLGERWHFLGERRGILGERWRKNSLDD